MSSDMSSIKSSQIFLCYPRTNFNLDQLQGSLNPLEEEKETGRNLTLFSSFCLHPYFCLFFFFNTRHTPSPPHPASIDSLVLPAKTQRTSLPNSTVPEALNGSQTSHKIPSTFLVLGVLLIIPSK